MPSFMLDSILSIPVPKISPISENSNSPKSKLGLTSLMFGNSKLAVSFGNSKSRSIPGNLFNSFSLVRLSFPNSIFISGIWINLSYAVGSFSSNSLKNTSIARENLGMSRFRKKLKMSILRSGISTFGSFPILENLSFNSEQGFENSGSPSDSSLQIIFATASS